MLENQIQKLVRDILGIVSNYNKLSKIQSIELWYQSNLGQRILFTFIDTSPKLEIPCHHSGNWFSEYKTEMGWTGVGTEYKEVEVKMGTVLSEEGKSLLDLFWFTYSIDTKLVPLQ